MAAPSLNFDVYTEPVSLCMRGVLCHVLLRYVHCEFTLQLRCAFLCRALLCCRLAENRCNSSEVMRMLLDPHLPINRVLPAVLEVCFGGPPRFGVTRLAVSGWRTGVELHQ